MATITMSSKNQVTLPADMVRGLGLKPGDKLVAQLIDDRIVLLPKPESWTEYFSGSLKGVYGSTKEEIDRYIAEVRHGWDIGALKEALIQDPELRAVYDVTSSTEELSVRQIAERVGKPKRLVIEKLEELEKLDAVKPLTRAEKPEIYYRRIP